MQYWASKGSKIPHAELHLKSFVLLRFLLGSFMESLALDNIYFLLINDILVVIDTAFQQYLVIISRDRSINSFKLLQYACLSQLHLSPSGPK